MVVAVAIRIVDPFMTREHPVVGVSEQTISCIPKLIQPRILAGGESDIPLQPFQRLFLAMQAMEKLEVLHDRLIDQVKAEPCFFGKTLVNESACSGIVMGCDLY